MNLNNFENDIESKIVARGASYFNNELIIEIEEINENEFAAIVEGTEDYAVYFELDDELNIIIHDCDCPYDWGDFCKHKVAVLFYLREAKANNQSLNEGKLNQLRVALEEVHEIDLRKILMELATRSKVIREDVLYQLGIDDDDSDY